VGLSGFLLGMGAEQDIFAPIKLRRKMKRSDSHDAVIPDNKLFIRPFHKEDGQLSGVEYIQNGDFFFRVKAYGNDIDYCGPHCPDN
jgi:hypothetical protein